MVSLVTDQVENTSQQTGLVSAESCVGMWTCQLWSDYRTCCEEWFQLYGLTCPTNRQCQNEMWLQSVHPIDRPRMNQLIGDLHSGKITRLNERYRALDANGHWKWILTRAEPSGWSDNAIPTQYSGVDIFLSDVAEDNQLVSLDVPTKNQDQNAVDKGMLDVIKTLSVALESAGQGVWYIDERANGITSVNGIWRTMRGYTATGDYSPSKAKACGDIHPDDLAMVTNRNDIRDEMNTNIIDYTYRHRHKDGTWRWIWVRGKITERDNNGKPLVRIGSDTDITSIKETELRFERLSITLNLAMQAAGMGVWDRRTNVEGSYWDKRACKVFGIGDEGRFVPSAEFISLVHPDDRIALEHELDLANKACRPIAVDYRIIHPSLGTRYIKTHADYHGYTDEPSRYVGLVWDVTDAYQRESELADAKNLLDDVIEHMDQGLAFFRGNNRDTSRVALANDRFFSILELPDHLRSPDTTVQTFMNYLESNNYLSTEASAAIDLFVQQIDDREISAVLLTTPSGQTVRGATRRMEPDGFIVTFSDITDLIRAKDEQKELSERLSHNHRMQSIGELTGGVAHDFNNLLAIIAGNAELFSMSIDDNNRHLQAISDAAHRGAELTQSLLAFSSKQSLKPAPINMNSLVEKVRRMLGRTLGDTIRVRSTMPNTLWTCMADPGQLENALINLAVNARDAMPQGGTINIQVTNKGFARDFATTNTEVIAGEYIQVTVTDTGAGMTNAVLNKAIDPFFTTKRVGEGSGLGLSMVFGFVKQSSGHMDISSIVGRGTTVSIYLPRNLNESNNEPAAASTARNWKKGEGQRILLVEDEPDVKHMLNSSLTKLGYKIVSVSTASEAIEAIDSSVNTFDLIISDVMLPDGVNGFELGKAISKQYPDLPIIYMSGYAQGALAETYGDSDDIDLLHKPFGINELARKIADSLVPVTS